jgi:hypothetical protein
VLCAIVVYRQVSKIILQIVAVVLGLLVQGLFVAQGGLVNHVLTCRLLRQPCRVMDDIAVAEGTRRVQVGKTVVQAVDLVADGGECRLLQFTDSLRQLLCPLVKGRGGT